MSEPEPRCAICGRRARHHYLVKHGEGSGAFWLCAQHDREAEQVMCSNDDASRLLEAARDAQG